MVIKYNPTESYDAWADRVRLYETEIASRRLSNGDNLEEVLESMSKRLMQKLLNPIYSALRESHTVYDNEASIAEYKRIYLDKNKPKADQVDGEIFDKLG